MKTCRTCQKPQPLKCFSKRGKGLQPNCKTCANKAARASYLRRKAKVIARTKSQVESKKAFIASLKNKPCVDCGRQLPPWGMQFDHLRDKVETLSRMGANNRTLETIQAEAAKCEVVCILCHRHRTYMRGKYPLMLPEHEAMVRRWRQGG